MADKTIDRKFIKEQLKHICKARGSACNSNIAYCRTLDPEDADQISCGKCIGCVVHCFIGDNWAEDSRIRDAINDCLKASVNIDWLLHLSQKRYRDHSTHALFVGVLGWFLLGCNIGGSSTSSNGVTLKEWISETLDLEEGYVEIAWWIASLLHDHAYPLQHMLRVAPSLATENREIWLNQIWALLGFKQEGRTNPLNEVLKDLYNHAFLRTLRGAVEKSANDCERRGNVLGILKEYLAAPHFFGDSELCKESESCYDHGLLGAANISALLGKPDIDTIKQPDNKTIKTIRTAVRAIGIHNGATCPESIDVQKEPLAFLLALCDECQEWERRILVKGDRLKSESRSIELRGLEKKQCGIYKISDFLEVVFEYTDPVCLRDTKWDYQEFKGEKEKAFKRFRISEGFPIKGIRFDIWLPHEVRFELEEKPKGESQ